MHLSIYYAFLSKQRHLYLSIYFALFLQDADTVFRHLIPQDTMSHYAEFYCLRASCCIKNGTTVVKVFSVGRKEQTACDFNPEWRPKLSVSYEKVNHLVPQYLLQQTTFNNIVTKSIIE